MGEAREEGLMEVEGCSNRQPVAGSIRVAGIMRGRCEGGGLSGGSGVCTRGGPQGTRDGAGLGIGPRDGALGYYTGYWGCYIGY